MKNFLLKSGIFLKYGRYIDGRFMSRKGDEIILKKTSRGLQDPKPKKRIKSHLSITPVVVHESNFERLRSMIASLPPNIQDRIRRAREQYMN